MADRRVKLILEADSSQFTRGMDDAARSADGVKSSAQDIGREWTRASRTMQGDMRTVGTGFAAVGGSILGVYGSLVSTGIEYNTLQQVAGRSLETVMGSASAAADQMERLHEFADTSPFARQTWIQAQMQLAAFGMEAERIVPTLEAVQNAVAAIGGGDAEIMRIVDILGAVEGQGRFTGRELQRLGQMGIDAAELIGDAMGVSGNEIREQITAGSLDAETAITALTDGMMMRFDGAAEGMRETMTGAWDRIKAAWRDLGSVLAAPLVDPEGGGGLVWLTNAAADLLRMIQQLPDPVLQTVGAMSGFAGAGMAAYGMLLFTVPQLVAFHDAKKRLAADMPKTTGLVGGLTRALGFVATAYMAAQAAGAAFNEELQVGNADSFGEALIRLGGNADASAARLDELAYSNMGIGGTLVDLQDAFNVFDTGGFERALKSPMGAMGMLNDQLDASQAVFASMDGALAQFVSDGNLEAAADSFLFLSDYADEAGWTISQFQDAFPGLKDALYAANINMDEFSAAVGLSSAVVDEATGEYKNADITLEELAARMAGVDDAATAASDGSAELAAALEEVGLSADGAIESLETFLDLLYQAGLLTMSARDAQSSYENQLDATKASIDELNDEASEMGRILNDNKTDFDLTTEAGRLAQDQFHGVARSGMDLTQALAENGATQDEVQSALRRTYDDLIRAGQGMGMTEDDARSLTREVLGIPDDVDIDTWLDSTAEDQVKSLQRELDSVNGRRTWSRHDHTITTTERRIMQRSGTGARGNMPGYSTGGSVIGPGTGTSDDIAAWLSNGEHVLTARDVQAMGGQRGVYNFRESLHNPRPPAREMMPAYSLGGAVPRGGSGGAGVAVAEAPVTVQVSMAGALIGSREIARHLADDMSAAIQSKVINRRAKA